MSHFKRKLLFALGTSGAIIAALLIAIIFFGRSISKHSAQALERRNEIVNRAASLDALASLISQYNEKGKKYLDVLQSVIPVRDQLFNLKQEFQILATQASLDYSFEFLDEKAPEGGELGSLTFRILLNGSFDKLLSFVRVIQQFRYLTTIENIGFARQAFDKNTMSIKGKVFFR